MTDTYSSSYEYECSKGHWLARNTPTTKCPAYTHGSPCKGTLTRVGKGSRSKAA